MHLHVDQDGKTRDLDNLAKFVFGLADSKLVPDGIAGWAVDPMRWHDEDLLEHLVNDLPAWIEDEQQQHDQSTRLLVQTGDVEALGGVEYTSLDWRDSFPSWAYVDRLAADCQLPQFHVFGNHDVWNRAFPGVAPWRRLMANDVASIDLLDGVPTNRWTTIPKVHHAANGIPIVIARVNTVAASRPDDALARGRVGPFPGLGATMPEVLESLRDQFSGWLDKEAIRIVLMHNPPHAFDASWFGRQTTSRLDGATALAKTLAELRVQLVITGHRHALDPPSDDEHYGATQRPLIAPTVQLAAESATQALPPNKDEALLSDDVSRSFCRYRLVVDEAARTFSVFRAELRHTASENGGGFVEQPDREVFAHLPLK